MKPSFFVNFRLLQSWHLGGNKIDTGPGSKGTSAPVTKYFAGTMGGLHENKVRESMGKMGKVVSSVP